MSTDATHDPNLKSWVESANDPGTDFPIQNLPWVRFEVPCTEHGGEAHYHGDESRLGVMIGDKILDLVGVYESGHFDEWAHAKPLEYMLWAMSHGQVYGNSPQFLKALRERLSAYLNAATATGSVVKRQREKLLRSPGEVKILAPCSIPNYTDFYASKFHASNVGSMFRPDNPLLPNYTHVPIGYHGRASSIVVSGTDIRRPRGQTKADDAAAPSFGPCAMLDYEMEMGVIMAFPNELGDPIPIGKAREHILGMCILNDWSARDFQKWEYQPLGPFLAKNFATSVSSCIVTMDALEPFRTEGPRREAGDPAPLPYLQSDEPWGLDITVEVHLVTKAMREKGVAPVRISRGSMKDLYWTVAQLVAHHTSNGCNLEPGDLLGTGTISGSARDSRGCLLELTWNAPGQPRTPVELPGGEKRTFLQDGDEVIMRAYCERDGFRRIGFGECRGIITPANAG